MSAPRCTIPGDSRRRGSQVSRGKLGYSRTRDSNPQGLPGTQRWIQELFLSLGLPGPVAHEHAILPHTLTLEELCCGAEWVWGLSGEEHGRISVKEAERALLPFSSYPICLCLFEGAWPVATSVAFLPHASSMARNCGDSHYLILA